MLGGARLRKNGLFSNTTISYIFMWRLGHLVVPTLIVSGYSTEATFCLSSNSSWRTNSYPSCSKTFKLNHWMNATAPRRWLTTVWKMCAASNTSSQVHSLVSHKASGTKRTGARRPILLPSLQRHLVNSLLASHPVLAPGYSR